MDDVIAALGAAEGGSDNLDAMIYRRGGGSDLVGYDCADDEVPMWTQLIDDAATLVPPGYAWVLFSDGNAGVALERRDADGQWHCPASDTTAATPALALCIAALRARVAVRGRAA